MSEAGLAKVRTTMRMKMEGGGEEPLESVEIKDTAKFSTGRIAGDGALGALEATVPFNKKSYRGQDLIALVQQWCKAGSAEATFETSVREVVQN